MIYTPKIREAIQLAIETHEVNRKQKRKAKDIPYIIHPLTVGIILASAGAKEDVIIAGILHDTIEDSAGVKVTKEMITNKFNKNIAELVLSVTEQNKLLSWEERKREALEHIRNFSNDSVLLKSADIISNVLELKDEYDQKGIKIFEGFNRPKEKILKVYENVAKELINKWPENPLKEDLNIVLEKITKML
jgi:(p)ppGpp synthase/HD superfamily hydrolase